jgi:hypothetical protein
MAEITATSSVVVEGQEEQVIPATETLTYDKWKIGRLNLQLDSEGVELAAQIVLRRMAIDGQGNEHVAKTGEFEGSVKRIRIPNVYAIVQNYPDVAAAIELIKGAIQDFGSDEGLI